MSLTPTSRREFLGASAQLLGGGWAALHLPLLASLAACAREAAGNGEPLKLLSAAEATTLGAFADRILPPGDGLPGATEAGALHFMDAMLGQHLADAAPLVQEGARELDRRAGGHFADVAPERQDEIIRELADTPFFFVGRTLVLAGVLADPSYGGNRDGAGMKLLGIEHHGANSPPFGYYDAEYARQAGGAA